MLSHQCNTTNSLETFPLCPCKVYWFQQLSMFYVLGIYLLLFLTKQKHEVDGTVTNETVSFIDVYQVKDKRGNYWLTFFDCIFLKAVCKVFNFFSFAIVFSSDLKSKLLYSLFARNSMRRLQQNTKLWSSYPG